MKIILGIFFFITLGKCVPSPRLAGGVPTSIERYPFMANLQNHFLSLVWMQACGGTLLTSSTVLTAAHCYHYSPIAISWRVQLGSTHREFGGTHHTVRHVIMHPDFDSITREANLAIMHLANPAELGGPRPISVASIAGPNYLVGDGSLVTAVGWGSLFNLGPAPDVLHRTTINKINLDICRQRYIDLARTLTNDMMCAGILDIGGRGICQGDSGGPLIHGPDEVVVGISSWSEGCGHEVYPSVFTRVSTYSDWIARNGAPMG